MCRGRLCEKRPGATPTSDISMTFPTDFKRDLLLAKTESVSDTDGNSRITYLRNDKKSVQKLREREVRKNEETDDSTEERKRGENIQTLRSLKTERKKVLQMPLDPKSMKRSA